MGTKPCYFPRPRRKAGIVNILANILMTALEDEIVRPLINDGTIKFYTRYVDDTLVLTKPKDIPSILNKFNSFHPQIQFTCEEFIDNNDIHFLDIKINSQGTTIYRKSTHIPDSILTVKGSLRLAMSSALMRSSLFCSINSGSSGSAGFRCS